MSLESIAEHDNSDEQTTEQCSYNKPGQQENLPTGKAACVQGVLTHTTGKPVGADGGQTHYHQDVGNHMDLCVVHHLKKENDSQRQQKPQEQQSTAGQFVIYSPHFIATVGNNPEFN